DIDFSTFLEEIEHIFFIYKNRAPVLSTYIVCLVVTLISAACMYFFGTKRRAVYKRIIRLLLLSSLSSPLLFLLLATIKMSPLFFVLTLFALSFLCGYFMEKMKKKAIFILGLLTFLFISL